MMQYYSYNCTYKLKVICHQNVIYLNVMCWVHVGEGVTVVILQQGARQRKDKHGNQTQVIHQYLSNFCNTLSQSHCMGITTFQHFLHFSIHSFQDYIHSYLDADSLYYSCNFSTNLLQNCLKNCCAVQISQYQ